MRTSIVGLALAFLAASATGVLAQETTGTNTGRVIDPQGLVVPGATITVIGPQGPNVVVSDGSGRFTAAFLTPGTYTVRAELQGFRPHELKNVDVRLAQTVDVDLALTVDALTDTVVVVQTVPVIDTTSTTTGINLDVETLSQLPVGPRFSDNLHISPGVSREVEVKTGGFESEFGQTTGGVVHVITKSGSNALRGSVFG